MKNTGSNTIVDILNRALSNKHPVSGKEIGKFGEKVEDIREMLNVLKTDLAYQIEFSRGRPSHTKKDDYRAGKTAELIEFERSMFQEFRLQTNRIDKKNSEDIQKFHLWKAIVLIADKNCKEAKEKFNTLGLFARPEEREELFNSLVTYHMELINTLASPIYSKFLPEDSVHRLNKISESLSNSQTENKPKVIYQDNRVFNQKKEGKVEKKPMSRKYILKRIGGLLLDAYDEDDFAELCLYHFEEFHNKSRGMEHRKRIRKLIDYCKRKDILDGLLKQIENDNLEKYNNHAPYYNVEEVELQEKVSEEGLKKIEAISKSEKNKKVEEAKVKMEFDI